MAVDRAYDEREMDNTPWTIKEESAEKMMLNK